MGKITTPSTIVSTCDLCGIKLTRDHQPDDSYTTVTIDIPSSSAVHRKLLCVDHVQKLMLWMQSETSVKVP